MDEVYPIILFPHKLPYMSVSNLNDRLAQQHVQQYQIVQRVEEKNILQKLVNRIHVFVMHLELNGNG